MNRIYELLKIEIYSVLYIFFYHLPGYYFSNKLRAWFMKLYLKKCGKKFMLNREVIIESPNKIEIGNNVQINARCWISGGGGIYIEDGVLIGPNVTIHSANHIFNDPNKKIIEQGHIAQPVYIEEDCWLGASVIILPGVRISKHCIIGAGSVVTKNTEPFSVYVGNPARKIRDLKDNNV